MSAGDRVADRYVLLRVLAEGGMGKVWVARDEKLGREVAVKVMHRGAGNLDDAQERFEREARAAAALRTSHVVAVYDFGAHEGLPFMAMELLEGESLADRFHREGRMPVGEVAALLRQIAKGLKAAHKAGLVHRDLKPSNIFLATRDDGDEIVKLLDFGIVKAGVETPSDATKSGVMLGTPQYMAPEQARGNRTVDHRADLWSMAVVAYEMVTGENPFWRHTETMADVFVRLCVEPIPAPSSLLPEGTLDVDLDAFFETALARDPFERFQRVEELLEAFALAAGLSMRGLDDLSVEASFPGWSRPASRRAPVITGQRAPTLTNDGLQKEQLPPRPLAPTLADDEGAVPEAPRVPTLANEEDPDAIPADVVARSHAATLASDDLDEEHLDEESSSSSPDDNESSDAAFYGDDLLEQLDASSDETGGIEEASSMTTSVVPHKRPVRLMGAVFCVAVGVGLGLYTFRDRSAPAPAAAPSASAGPIVASAAPSPAPTSSTSAAPIASVAPSASAEPPAPTASVRPSTKPRPAPEAPPVAPAPRPKATVATDSGGGPPTWYRSP